MDKALALQLGPSEHKSASIADLQNFVKWDV